MTKACSLLVALIFAASRSFAQAPAASALTRIGAAAAVQGRVQAQAPGAAVGRVVASGKPIFLNDHVTTGAAGRLQVLLLDETVFTLGPDSDMVLDQFVYDPATDAGKVAARITKGVFRFVTGKVARKDPASMTVRLPVGTIGIRGTIAMGQTDGNSSTVILLGPGGQTNTDEPAGAIVVDNGGVSRTVTAPGSGVTIKAGEAPSRVQDLSAKAQELTGLLQPPADLKAQNARAGAAHGSATQQAAQDTASGRVAPEAALDQTLSDSDRGQIFSQTAQDAVFGIADGVTTWDQIRQNITTGQGYFFEGDAQTVNCTGCAAGNSSIGSFQLQVDFGARTLGGTGGVFNPTSSASGSFIHIHGVNDAGATDTDQQLISTINFAALSGNAQVQLDPYLNTPTSTLGSTGVNFNGSGFKLVNSGGKVAASALVDFKYNATSSSTASVSASGALTAPRY